MKDYEQQVKDLDALTEGLRQDWKRDSKQARQPNIWPSAPPKYPFTRDLTWFLRRFARRITRSGK